MAAEGCDRRSFLELPAAVATVFAAGGIPAAFADDEWKTTASGLQYSVITQGKGDFKASKGDLAAIRFQGAYNGNVFDDILSAAEPLYFRIGDGRLLKVRFEFSLHLRSPWILYLQASRMFDMTLLHLSASPLLLWP